MERVKTKRKEGQDFKGYLMIYSESLRGPFLSVQPRQNELGKQNNNSCKKVNELLILSRTLVSLDSTSPGY